MLKFFVAGFHFIMKSR